MKRGLFLATLLLATSAADAGNPTGKIYKWTNEDGTHEYRDAPQPTDADKKKDILNDRGIKVGSIDGKKSEEELAEEARLAAIEQAKRDRQQKDQALLNTYLSVEEILLHMNRRVELWLAQARVTELYLSNLTRRLDELKRRASRFAPYSDDPDARQISPDLMADIRETEATIARHTENLEKFKQEETVIRDQFLSDVERFKWLKGLE